MIHNHCFAFESDFTADLRCLPMAEPRWLNYGSWPFKTIFGFWRVR